VQVLNIDDLRNINYVLNGHVVDQNENSILLTQSEIKQLVEFIIEMECCVENGSIQPPTLPFLSKLQQLTK
jgi:hypothetical protein